jgi:hypothetical protein
MTTKNFNAKKVLMSAVAAIVFSFVFTASANANTSNCVQDTGSISTVRV